MHILLFLLLAGFTTGQEQERWVEVHGSSVTSFDFASSIYPGSQLPANYFRQALNLELKIAGLPLGFSAFYSTGNQQNLQGMNAITLRFDYNRLLSALITDSLSRFRKIQRSLRWIVTLEAGDCHPNYSPLILNGINVKGVNIAVNPGPVYAAFVYGLSNRKLSNFGPYDEPYKRYLWMVKAGFGKVEKSHFYLSAMHAWDRPDSLKESTFYFPHPADTLIVGIDTIIIPGDTAQMKVTPAENWVAGAELALTFWKQKIRFEADATGSFYTPDQGAPDLQADNDAVKFFSFLNPRIGSHADWACRASLSVDLKKIKLKGSYSRTGPGYQTMGSPYLRQNMQTIEGRISGNLWKRVLGFNVFGKYLLRDPDRYESRRFKSLLTGLNATVRLKRGPYFTFMLLPSWLFSQADTMASGYQSVVTGLSSGYPWRIKSASCMTSLNLTYMKNRMIRDTLTDRISIFSLGLNQSVSLSQYLSSRLFFTWTNRGGTMSPSDLFSAGIDLQSNPWKWFSASLGFNYTNTDATSRQEVIALNCTLGFKPLKWLSFNAAVARNDSNGDFTIGTLPEWTGRVVATITF